MATDTEIKQFILNVMGKEQYKEAKENGSINPTELYLVDDDQSNSESLQPLTFTGAVEATYDGSTPVEVEIPMGGGGGYKWERIDEFMLDENVASVRIELPLEYSAFSIVFKGALVSETNTILDMRIDDNADFRPQFQDLQYRDYRPTQISIERRGVMFPIVRCASNNGAKVVNTKEWVSNDAWCRWNEFTYATFYAMNNEFASGYEITVFGVRA